MDVDKHELNMLQTAINDAAKKTGKEKVDMVNNTTIISIIENFLQNNNVICYGGTAINNILPKKDQFYNKDYDLPDYDFFAPNALDLAKKLADVYYKKGFTNVEAKSGVHAGTYKVFVDYMAIADITQLDKEIFDSLNNEAIKVDGIKYASANYLRMAAYLELSRPEGDSSRWEKVHKRLGLLNKHYPIDKKICNISGFIRKFEQPTNEIDMSELNIIYNTIKDSAISQGLVFFGGFALYAYGKYLPKYQKNELIKYPDFDVLAIDADKAANTIKDALEKKGVNNIIINKVAGIGEIISEHYEVVVNNESVVFVYATLACHSYNIIKINNRNVKIATIDTMFSFYLAFLFGKRSNYDTHRILCIAQYLYYIQSQNRLSKKGVFRRFSVDCYGDQANLEYLRSVKAVKRAELKNLRSSLEYEKYFLNYIPDQLIKTKSKKTKSKKTKSKKTKSKKIKSKKTKSKK